MRILVKFKGQPGLAVMADIGISKDKVKRRFTHVNAMALDVDKNELNKLKKNPNVVSIESDDEVHVLEDDEFDNSWGVNQIGSRLVHLRGIVGQNVKVAVIDTGIDFTHPELAGIYKGGWNFVDDNDNPMDDHSHGTHCAGIIAAAQNNEGVVGVAPGVELYALKVLNKFGSGNWSDVAAAIEWCMDNGIQITSNSYGGSGGSSILAEAFRLAWEAGILSIAAAGNTGGGESVDSVNYPAKYEYVVAVAATEPDKSRAVFSSTGPCVEISAPGVGIRSTIPGNKLKEMSGTSMACPHVAGVAALVWSMHPDWSNRDVRGQMDATCDDLGREGHDWLYGYGIVNAPLACAKPTTDSMWVNAIGFTEKYRTLIVVVEVVDYDHNLLKGAQVEVKVERGEDTFSAAGITDDDGLVMFELHDATPGEYVVTVTSLIYHGLIWDDNKGVNKASHTILPQKGCNLAQRIRFFLRR